MKKIFSFFIIFTLFFTSIFSLSAQESPSQKEEVVYGILNLDGSINNLYVVNIFTGGSITDYGCYTDIRNMTTSERLLNNDEQITINTAADKFYYQGTLEKKELPWDISIKYYLDGKEITGSELAGKSGKCKIDISVKQNVNSNNSFFNNYALQIALSLDNKLCSDIRTNNATVAEAGSKKQLSYTILPGNGSDISVTADVHDFKMDAISINGIKLSLGIAIDKDKFTNQIMELSNAIKGLDEGAADLLNGLNQFSDGMQKYVDGLEDYKNGISQLADGADKLNLGATDLKNGLSELAKQNDSLAKGALSIQQATFDSVNNKLGNMGLGLPPLTPENYITILTPIPSLAQVKMQLDSVSQFTKGLQSYLNGVSYISNGASDLVIGTSEFKSSSSIIAASANDLYNAGKELNDSIKKLRDGLSLYKDGTKELMNGTADMGTEINSKIDEILGSISDKNDKVTSFVSDKNTNISAVQFVLKTASINIPEAQKDVGIKPAELSFWQKILKLFGFYK